MKLSNIKKLTLCALFMLGFVMQAQNHPSDFAKASTDMSINSGRTGEGVTQTMSDQKPFVLSLSKNGQQKKHSISRGCQTFSADNLESLVEGVCEIYEEITSAKASCAAIPISQADFNPSGIDEEISSSTSAILHNTLIINQSGNYCLTEDVTGTIIISDINNVTIDLNGFSITTILPNQVSFIFENTVTHATVKNGTINGYITFDPGTYTDIKLFNLNITGGEVHALHVNCAGIRTTFSTGNNFSYLLVGNVVVVDGGIILSGENCDLQIINSDINMLSLIANSAAINIEKSTINNCSIIAYTGYGVIKDTVFESNVGCYINAPNFVLLDCTALNNTDNMATGFYLDVSAIDTIIERSSAIGNTESGFTIIGNNNLIRHCIAESNGSSHYPDDGFNVTGSAVEVLDCIACNNLSTNYNGVTAPVLTIGDTNFAAGYNVSCD